MSKNRNVFIQIASYRDRELPFTLKDCIAKAKHPDRLRFGICWQRDETETLGAYREDGRFRIIDCPWNQSKGVSWARHKIQELYDGEGYTLQLDSHHRFAQDWDEQLIGMLKQTGSQKPILTAHAPQYMPEHWEAGSAGPQDKDMTPYKIVSSSFTANGMIELKSIPINNWQTLVQPLRARFLSCHFYFTLGDHCLECKYDPLLYFSEQEIRMTLRSYTMGYDLFHPHKSLIWHEYVRSGKPKHWDDHTEALVLEGKTDLSWEKRDLSSKARIQRLLQQEGSDTGLGIYGLGTHRTLEDYQKYAGIDFRNQRFHRDTLDGKEPPVFYKKPEQWDTEFFDIKEASLRREEYFTFFNKNGVKYPASGNLSKPVIGTLSPGCETCIKGTWSCLFITDACTKACFFCPAPQSKKDTNQPPKGPEQITYDSVDAYMDFLGRFDFEGVSFSGGEAFLVVDRMLEYIHKIRQCFGDQHYIWAYTNGDLVSDKNLSLLRKAGLNELRFNIAANKYDLAAVEKAIGYIETVTIEIPAIPEDIPIVKSLLKEMADIGVKHLNLHQLMKTDHNSREFDQQGYSPVNRRQHPDHTPILESELAACEILKYAIETQSQLGINYCSSCYKARFQSVGHRKRGAKICRSRKFSVTETGYLSQLAINASTDEAAYIKDHLSEEDWEIAGEGENAELLFSVEHLDLLLKETYTRADVIYHEASLAPACNGAIDSDSLDRPSDHEIGSRKNMKFRLALENNTSAFLFYRLFVERKTVQSVVNELLDLYHSDGNSSEDVARDVRKFYEGFQGAEYLPRDLEPYE